MNVESTRSVAPVRRGRRLAVSASAALLAVAALVGLGQVAAAGRASSSHNVIDKPEAPSACPGNCLNGLEIFTGTYNQAWTLTGHANGPRWNYVTTGSSWLKHVSPPAAMWFGDPATGEFGGEGGEIGDGYLVYSGALTYIGPAIPIPTQDTLVFMSFWSWERTEISLPTLECYQQITCTFDARMVFISGTSPIHNNWQPVWNTQKDFTIENQWHGVAIDLATYKGESIRVMFKFDTVDARNNDAGGVKPAGWFIDDVRFFSFTPSAKMYLPIVFKNR